VLRGGVTVMVKPCSHNGSFQPVGRLIEHSIVADPAITRGEEVVLLFAAIRLLLRAMLRAGRSDASLGETGRQNGSDTLRARPHIRWSLRTLFWHAIARRRACEVACRERRDAI
jgi:hypothetical protein